MKVLSGLIAVCITMQISLVPATMTAPGRLNKPNKQKIPEVDPAILEDVADETMTLISTGKDKIHLADSLKDVVLVVGNTGVGKTTLSKFITGQKLLAYKSGSRYLIKDIQGDISANSTLVSKTIYPDVFRDETGTTYYDLPGFSDTRNASVELANAWFMKMVADHVDKVKIICIVNFSSLKTGESRTDFKSFLEHIIKFVVQPEKFKSSIALLASKVDHHLADDDVVPGIAEFLTQADDDIQNLFTDDDEKLEKAQVIIEAFLHTNSAGTYDRIGFFKQPNQGGEFDQMPYFVGRRRDLRKMVSQSLKFTAKNREDFGISVSESAVLYVRKVVEKLNMKFVSLMETVSNGLTQDFASRGQSINPGMLLNVIDHLERMERKLRNATTRSAFLQILTTDIGEMPIMSATMKEMKLLDQSIVFYEHVDGRRVPPQPLQWVQPLKAVTNQLQNQVQEVMRLLNNQVEQAIGTFANSIKTAFTSMLNNAAGQSMVNQEAVAEIARRDSQTLKQLRNSLSADLTFNAFMQKIHSGTAGLSFKSSLAPLDVAQLPQDIQVNSALPLKMESWMRIFLELSEAISQELNAFNSKLMDQSHKNQIGALNANMSIIQQQSKNATLEAENKITVLGNELALQKEESLKKQQEVDGLHGSVNQLKGSVADAEARAEEARRIAKEEADAAKALVLKLETTLNQVNQQRIEDRRQAEQRRIQDEADRRAREQRDRERDERHRRELENIQQKVPERRRVPNIVEIITGLFDFEK